MNQTEINTWRKAALIGLCAAGLLGAGSLNAEGHDTDSGADCRGAYGGEKHGRRGHYMHPGHQSFHGGFPQGEDGDERHFQRMAERLNLSGEQQEAIQETMQALREEGKTLHEKARASNMALMDAIHAGASEKTLRKLLARVAADDKVDLMLHVRESRQSIDAHLTDEQKAKVDVWHEHMEDHRKMRRNPSMAEPDTE